MNFIKYSYHLLIFIIIIVKNISSLILTNEKLEEWGYFSNSTSLPLNNKSITSLANNKIFYHYNELQIIYLNQNELNQLD